MIIVAVFWTISLVEIHILENIQMNYWCELTLHTRTITYGSDYVHYIATILSFYKHCIKLVCSISLPKVILITNRKWTKQNVTLFSLKNGWFSSTWSESLTLCNFVEVTFIYHVAKTGISKVGFKLVEFPMFCK